MKWKFDLCEFSDRYDIHDGKGNKIHFSIQWKDKSRIVISSGTYSVDSITVSSKKSAREIVLRDIKTRFFDQYKAKAKSFNEDKRVRNSARNSRINDYLEFAKILKTKYKKNNNPCYDYIGGRTLKIEIESETSYRGKYNLSFNTSNKQKVLEIIKLINN